VERAVQLPSQVDAADAVLEALRHVVEPHLGINLVDLGLVYAVHAADGVVRIELGVLMPQAGGARAPNLPGALASVEAAGSRDHA
jgi:hypothetical protein